MRIDQGPEVCPFSGMLAVATFHRVGLSKRAGGGHRGRDLRAERADRVGDACRQWGNCWSGSDGRSSLRDRELEHRSARRALGTLDGLHRWYFDAPTSMRSCSSATASRFGSSCVLAISPRFWFRMLSSSRAIELSGRRWRTAAGVSGRSVTGTDVQCKQKRVDVRAGMPHDTFTRLWSRQPDAAGAPTSWEGSLAFSFCGVAS